jgi:hypothetical protein
VVVAVFVLVHEMADRRVLLARAARVAGRIAARRHVRL